MKQLIFIPLFIIVFSCSKENRFINQMDGDWSLDKMRVIDGQSTEHILEDVNGTLNLNFDVNTSDGFAFFDLNLNNQIYSFSVQFEGDDLIYLFDESGLIMGKDDERMTYKLILLTKRDLVLEYYHDPSFQLRKFVFVKQE